MKNAFPAVLTGLVLAFPCFAQQPTELVTPEVVVTATRFEERAADQPIAVKVISSEQIRASGARTLPDILARQAGIAFRDNTGSPDWQVDMRGFGITGDQNTLVLVDGQRLNDNELSAVRWSSIPLSSVERIEILGGSGAVLYGGGATGGVINIVTRQPRTGARSIAVEAGGGSYDTGSGRASATVAGQRLGLTADTQYLATNNYRDHNALRQRNAEIGLRTLDPGPSLRLTFGAERQDLELPGARTNAQLETDRRGATTPQDYSDRETTFLRGGLIMPTDYFEFAMDLGYRDKHSEARFFGSTRIDTDADVWSLAPRIKLPYQVVGVSNTFVSGVDWERWSYGSTRTGPAHVSAEQLNRAIYLQNSSELTSATRFSVGGRVQAVDYEARDAASNQPYAAGSQSRTLRAYEFALRQQLTEQWSTYAKLGRSFRVATVDEIYSQFGGPLFDPQVAFLEPQTSHDREIGAEQAGRRSRMRVALYQMDLANEIRLNPVTFRNENSPPSRRYGIETEIAWTAMSGLEVGVSYSYAVAKFSEGTLSGMSVDGKNVPLVPRHRAALWTSAALSGQTALAAELRYTGRQYLDGDETNSFGSQMPAYTVVDLKVSRSMGRWRLQAATKNLTDRRYYTYAVRSQSTPGLFNAYPAPERTFFVSAEYRFGN
jgi:iron complex outermembrane receptor protein